MQISKKFTVLIKLIIVALAFWFIYKKVFANDNYLEFKVQFLNFSDQKNYFNLILVCGLMILNWSIDAIKWQFLIHRLEKVSFWLSLKAVFLGITVSIFTPNRVGEFGGRVFCLKYANRLKAVLVTIFGNFTQLITTVLFGLLALSTFCLMYDSPDLSLVSNYKVLIVLLCLFSAILLVYIVFNITLLSPFLSKWNRLKKYQDYWQVFSTFSKQEILKVLMLSVSRYLVYSFQFFLLIRFVDIDISLLQSFTMSALTFLSLSIIPTIALTEIGVRGSVSLYFFGFLTTNTSGVLTATFALWIINLVIPALVGSFFVYQLKFFRK
ncbi:MAG: lysylphosphatidylglycerol synthase domain-containing protein [Flavobacteriales bacterium]